MIETIVWWLVFLAFVTKGSASVVDALRKLIESLWAFANSAAVRSLHKTAIRLIEQGSKRFGYSPSVRLGIWGIADAHIQAIMMWAFALVLIAGAIVVLLTGYLNFRVEGPGAKHLIGLAVFVALTMVAMLFRRSGANAFRDEKRLWKAHSARPVARYAVLMVTTFSVIAATFLLNALSSWAIN